MMRLAFACLLLAACDPVWSLDVTADLPASANGRAAVMISYDEATWDGVHLPQPGSRGAADPMLAQPGDGPMNAETGSIGCPANVYVAVWVDLTGQSGLQELLGGRTIDQNGDYHVLDQAAALVPAPGDLLGISGPLHFGDGHSCGKTKQSTTVTVAPVQ